MSSNARPDPFAEFAGCGPHVPAAHGFPEAWALAWGSLPESVRLVLLRHWSQRDIGYRPSPRIEVVEDWPGRGKGGLSHQRLEGRRLQFWAPIVRILPTEQLATLIAHELAAVWFCACGRPADAEEKACERMAGSWGFEAATLYAWMHEHKALLPASLQS